MILGFKKVFPWGEPTNFKEKILAGVGYGPIAGPPKIHTIRAGSRWKAGDLIHMAYGVRSKNYEQFNKGIEGLQRVVSVQDVFIPFSIYAYEMRMVSILIDDEPLFSGQVMKNGSNSCSPDDRKFIESFAKNDGFKDSMEFFKWFRKDFEGQIIHWTDYRYK